MRAVVQRVARAEVRIGTEVAGRIGRGLVILLGVHRNDQPADARWLCEKILQLRIFEDEAGKLNLSLHDVKGEALVVSQFTLLADVVKGRRPSFSSAAEPEKARSLYEHFVDWVRRSGVPCATGRFGAHMAVELVNDGPVTIVVDTPTR